MIRELKNFSNKSMYLALSLLAIIFTTKHQLHAVGSQISDGSKSDESNDV